MHDLNNNTDQVQKMPMFMKALKILYVCSQKTCTGYISFQLLVFKANKKGENAMLRTLEKVLPKVLSEGYVSRASP